MASKNYDWIDFTPPQEVADAAQKWLDLRKEHDSDAGTDVWIARWRDLSNRRTCSPDTINHMVNYFARHEVDKDAEDFGNDDSPSNWYIAWLLRWWDAWRERAESIKNEMESYNEE